MSRSAAWPHDPLAPAPLTAIPVGALATLHSIPDADARALLRSLGLTQASHLRLCKLGDPCIVQVRATRIAMSRAVAESVYVVVAPTREAVS